MTLDRFSKRDCFFVLRRQPLGETDDIIVALGFESGLFSGVVKGARKEKSRISGLLEPPVELEGQIRPGRNLDSLSQLQLKRSFAGLRTSLKALLTAGFLARLFAEALPDRSPQEGIYELFGTLYDLLADGRGDVAVIALWAQERLLSELGVAPEIDSCLACGSDQVRGYSATDGGMLCGPCYAGQGFSVPAPVLNALRLLRKIPFEGPESNLVLQASVIREIGRVYKHQFQQHLGLSDRVFRPVLPKGRPS